jgi:2-oxoglutarate dehydrogenase E1 component
MLEAVSAAMSLVKAHRTHGHLAARLDPLGSDPVGDPALEASTVGLTPEVLARIPASLLRVYVPGDTAAEVMPRLHETYCGTIAYEIEHISDHRQRVWLREEIESGAIREPLPPEQRRRLLERLVDVEVFERFLRTTYLGQKTFSVEGVDALIPVLEEIIELAGVDGAQEVVMGMAHRGRLATIVHVVGRPPESVLSEFEGLAADDDEADEDDHRETAGDVKYHLGAAGTYVTRAGKPIAITLAANPSHLEQVNAVVEGRTRARQTIRKGNRAFHDRASALPLLVHGDAAFPGQGVNAETLNLQALAGYTTGGTVHVIANNQVGFTTEPDESRSTRYASDLAKGFDMPIVHVNADDVEACVAAVRLAVRFRQRFGHDALIDLIGYRRLGHNEVDEPAYTQPSMYRAIRSHPTVAEVYARRLVGEGAISEGDVTAMRERAKARLTDAHRVVTQTAHRSGERDHEVYSRSNSRTRKVRTSVPADTLMALNEQLLAVPDDHGVHPKLAPQLERRRAGMGVPGGIVWGHAEALALASLLTQGVPVRLTGQDAARGTFSQRHLSLHHVDEEEEWASGRGRAHIPMANLVRASATFELHNSPLSEAACVGFEYGYSTQAPEALVLWEAQYGDFANGAQIMIDQFIVSGRAKWGETSRLTLLLPHGYEGNGPEHSSGRLERFLRLGAEDNIRVAVPSRADQYFHLLRKQGLIDQIRPLIVFTPKSLLRAKSAACSLSDLTDGRFEPVLDDPRTTGRHADVRRLIICSGKIFHELDAHPEREAAGDLAIARIEMLYPFPRDEIEELLESYPNVSDVTWVQEEPRNMGGWSYVTRRLSSMLPEGMELTYVGRSVRASPSEGYPQAHTAEQQRILATALGGVRAGDL